MNHLCIAICTHNRAELLQHTLDSINQAQRPEHCVLEILVVANACTDNTHQMLNAYQDSAEKRGEIPLRWAKEPKPGKSNALNTLIRLIKAPAITFVDDDHRVDDCYLINIVKAFERYPETELFCGRILPDWDGSEPAWVHDRGSYRIYPLPVPRFDQGDKPQILTPDIAIPGGGNIFLHYELLVRVGDFSTNFGPKGHDLGGAEDLQWVLRAQESGAMLQYVPDVIQYHYVDPERLRLSYLIKKAYERSASTVRISKANTGPVIPNYMYRKIAGYLFSAIFCLHFQKRRFYLMRLAAALGEIKGFLILHREAKDIAEKKA